jgi:hypothetical protein
MDSALPLTRVTELLLDTPTTIEQTRGRRFEARYVTITDAINGWPWDRYRSQGFTNARSGDRWVYASGPNIKKDGTFGKMLGGEAWSVPDRHNVMPGWLAEIVDQVPHALDDDLD